MSSFTKQCMMESEEIHSIEQRLYASAYVKLMVMMSFFLHTKVKRVESNVVCRGDTDRASTAAVKAFSKENIQNCKKSGSNRQLINTKMNDKMER